MNKTILVIGSVTAKQYEAARIAILREGHKPKIVHASIDDVVLEPEELLQRYSEHDFDVTCKLDDQTLGNSISKCAAKHIEQYGNIGSLVVSNEVYEENFSGGSFDNPWYDFMEKIPTWWVHDTDYVELIS